MVPSVDSWDGSGPGHSGTAGRWVSGHAVLRRPCPGVPAARLPARRDPGSGPDAAGHLARPGPGQQPGRAGWCLIGGSPSRGSDRGLVQTHCRWSAGPPPRPEWRPEGEARGRTRGGRGRLQAGAGGPAPRRCHGSRRCSPSSSATPSRASSRRACSRWDGRSSGGAAGGCPARPGADPPRGGRLLPDRLRARRRGRAPGAGAVAPGRVGAPPSPGGTARHRQAFDADGGVIAETLDAVRTSDTRPEGALVGQPASPGRATGLVRVVRGPEDFERF